MELGRAYETKTVSCRRNTLCPTLTSILAEAVVMSNTSETSAHFGNNIKALPKLPSSITSRSKPSSGDHGPSNGHEASLLWTRTTRGKVLFVRKGRLKTYLISNDDSNSGFLNRQRYCSKTPIIDALHSTAFVRLLREKHLLLNDTEKKLLTCRLSRWGFAGDEPSGRPIAGRKRSRLPRPAFNREGKNLKAPL